MTNQPTPRLVPDDFEIWQEDGRVGYTTLGFPICSLDEHGFLEFSGEEIPLTPELIQSLLPALAFFAREGRLPTREDDEPWGKCKASELDAIAFPGIGVVPVRPKEAQGDG